ncbi:MAG: hypothetical protein ACTMIK_12415 [Galactobacter sp.]
METEMTTFSTDRIAAELLEHANNADLYPGDPASSAEIADEMSETAGPCAVHPYMDVRDAYLSLTAFCGLTEFHFIEDAFSANQIAPAEEARTLAAALRRHPEIPNLTLEVPAEGGCLCDIDFKSRPF